LQTSDAKIYRPNDYRVDIGHIVLYRYRQEKYRNFDISLSFRSRFDISETTSTLSIYFLFN